MPNPLSVTISDLFPHYVYRTYDVTHSLVVWTAITGIVCLFTKQFPWIFCAWGLHILCDIRWHEISFFPTPYLWPFKTPLVNGVHCAHLWLMVPNYVALTIAYARRRHKPVIHFTTEASV